MEDSKLIKADKLYWDLSHALGVYAKVLNAPKG